MTTAHRYGPGSKIALGLILAGVIAAQPANAEITGQTAADPTAVQTIEPNVTLDAATAVPSAPPIIMPAAAPYDPYANSEQPVEIDPALIPPPAE